MIAPSDYPQTGVTVVVKSQPAGTDFVSACDYGRHAGGNKKADPGPAACVSYRRGGAPLVLKQRYSGDPVATFEGWIRPAVRQLEVKRNLACEPRRHFFRGTCMELRRKILVGGVAVDGCGG